MMQRRLMLTGWLAVAGLLVLSQLVIAANWTRFRGPNGAGAAADKEIPVKWDDKDGIVWKLRLPGLGHSSPVLWGKRLFVQCASKDGKERTLVCVDVATGSILWSKAAPGTTAKTHQKNSLASSSPAVDADRVYTTFWDGKSITVAAYDHDGKSCWTRDLGTFTSQHGPGASPVVEEGRVFYANDQDGTSTLYAFDAKNGETLWKADRPAFRACYGAPMFRDLPGGKRELIVVSTRGLTGYEPATGKQSWNWELVFSSKMPQRITASPVLANDVLLVSCGDGSGDRHSAALQLKTNGNGTEPKLLWELKKDFPYVPSALTVGDEVYFVNDKGFAGCYDAKTGTKKWLERLPGATAFSASPVLIDGKVYAVSEEGDVYVFAAQPSFQLLAKNTLGELTRATPAVADNRLYIRSEQTLFCIGKRSASSK